MTHPSLICALFCVLATPARAAPPLHGEVAVTPAVKITVDLREEPKAEDRIDFSRDGKLLQTESALGDRFQPFLHGGQSAYFHSADLFGDGHKEIFVRLIMVPMGVIRVFRWNETTQKIERLTFGAKKEDGLPVPLLAPVTLEENGDLTYSVKRKGGRTVKLQVHWNGHAYELPPKEVR